jgi:hypothetical protein
MMKICSDQLICQNLQLHTRKICMHVAAVCRIHRPSRHAMHDGYPQSCAALMFYSVPLCLSDDKNSSCVE